MDEIRVPQTAADVAALEASYQGFEPAAAWSQITCDTERWQRHLEALRTRVDGTENDRWADVRDRFLRAAALDSSVLGELARPVPELTTAVLRQSIRENEWSKVVESTQIAVECHRRALVVASDAAQADRAIDENLIARLQDLIVEAQQTYTVTIDDGSRMEVELPRRQYKPVSNYLIRFPAADEIVAFAPASRVAEEMGRLVNELASDAFAALHPVVQSAYLHAALARIHPFADGNGRLARTVASMPLLRVAGLPQLILADQWPAYVTALDYARHGDQQPLVNLFLAAQINTMDLASGLLAGTAEGFAALPPGSPAAPQRTVLDLIRVHVRTALEALPERWRVAVIGDDDVQIRVVDDEGRERVATTIAVAADGPAWLRVTATNGPVLELARADVDPAPLEVVHLRVQSWLDLVLHSPGPPVAAASRVRGLFVLGVPRSGTTLFGNYLGSHPDVLGLAEYGGFYVANSLAPAMVNQLPGHEHEGLLAALRTAVAGQVESAARARGCSWFCDATPWNLEIAGALATQLPDAVFILLLRHFSGAVLSLKEFGWAGPDAAAAARLWASLNERITQLPVDRTIVLGYDAFAAEPAEVVAGLGDALATVGLDPAHFDATQFAMSHAALIGKPRPTVASVRDGTVEFTPVRSLDTERWTPEIHAAVWPVVADLHRALQARFPDVYVAPARPEHVAEGEW